MCKLWLLIIIIVCHLTRLFVYSAGNCIYLKLKKMVVLRGGNLYNSSLFNKLEVL